ncbi:MAG: hypothetical protein JST32_01340 [Bacteroidetes bacterium]|nr:hypothetical protein [Bacteroidota bacterium]
MKFLVATCLKEYQDDVSKLFKEAAIGTYSMTDITGVKQDGEPNLLQEWFAAGDEKFDSVIIFSFAPDENIKRLKLLIEKYNEQHQTGFPVRAFIMPVEETI